jgi:hypothetical protein
MLIFGMLLPPLIINCHVNYEIDPLNTLSFTSCVLEPCSDSGLGVIEITFRSLIVGNSVVANIQNWMFDRPEFPVKPEMMNLSFWGSTIGEGICRGFEFEKADKTVYPRKVDRTGEFRYADFPKCMYGEYRVFRHCYLLPLPFFKSQGRLFIRDTHRWMGRGPRQMKTFGL